MWENDFPTAAKAWHAIFSTWLVATTRHRYSIIDDYTPVSKYSCVIMDGI